MNSESKNGPPSGITLKGMCRVLGVSASGYYAWRRRCVRPAGQRATANEVLRVEIRALHAETKQRSGSRKIQQALARLGKRVNHKRVARLMRHEGLISSRFQRKRFKVTTNSNHGQPVAPNVLGRDFTAERPNAKWVSDITYVPTQEGWLYLAVVLDLFSRRIVGWAMAERMTRQLVINAFMMALQLRNLPTDGAGVKLLFHSDRGVQYASDDFTDLIGSFDITQSMSRRANCWDNAVAESFWASYKAECVPDHPPGFVTRTQAKSETFEYIEVFYNRQRLHSTLGYLTPVEFEAQAAVT